MPAARRRSTSSSDSDVRTYVIDTSVLLSDPHALMRFDEHEVVIPVVVVVELEAKRSHPELGYFARQALRFLDDLRVTHGRLDHPMPIGDSGGTLRVELNHTDTSILPSGFQLGDNDTRILAVARNLAAEGRDVVVVSKDLPMRVKASSVGLTAEEYRAELVIASGWTGMSELDVAGSVVDALYENDRIDLDEARDLPCHTGLVLVSERGSALARVTPDKQIRLVRGDREAFGLHGRSAEQRVALDLLLDPEVGIVSLGGSESEKMSPWGQAVYDTLGSLTTQEVVEEITDRGMLEVLPLTHIRGRSLHDAFVIVDEAQSLERNVLLTVLSRIGRDSRVVLTHDVAQRDHLRVGRHDGIVAVTEKLKGHPLFAHVTLTRSERSPIAALVTEMLEDLQI